MKKIFAVAGALALTIGTAGAQTTVTVGPGLDFETIQDAIASYTPGGANELADQPLIINIDPAGGPYNERLTLNSNVAEGAIVGDIVIQTDPDADPFELARIALQADLGDDPTDANSAGLRILQDEANVTLKDMIIYPSTTGDQFRRPIIDMGEHNTNTVFNTVRIENSIITEVGVSGEPLITSREQAFDPPVEASGSGRDNTFANTINFAPFPSPSPISMNLEVVGSTVYGASPLGGTAANHLRVNIPTPAEDGMTVTVSDTVFAYGPGGHGIRAGAGSQAQYSMSMDEVIVYNSPPSGGNHLMRPEGSPAEGPALVMSITNSIFARDINLEGSATRGISGVGGWDLETLENIIINAPSVGIVDIVGDTNNPVTTWRNLTVHNNSTGAEGVLLVGGAGALEIEDSILSGPGTQLVGIPHPVGGTLASYSAFPAYGPDQVTAITEAEDGASLGDGIVELDPAYAQKDDPTAADYFAVQNNDYAGAASDGSDLRGGAAFLGGLDVPLPAFARVLHAAPEVPAVDVLVNGDEENRPVTGLTFPNGTNYLQLPDGTYTFDVVPEGEGVAESALNVSDLVLEEAVNYTIAAYGVSEIEGIVLVDDLEGIAAGQIRIRAIHVADGVGVVDILNLTADPQNPGVLFEALDYGDASATLDVPVQTYTIGIDVGQTGEADLVYVIPAAALPAGAKAVNLYAINVPAPDKDNGDEVILLAQFDNVADTASIPAQVDPDFTPIWEVFDTVGTPDGTGGIIRLAADSTGKLYASRSTPDNMIVYASDDLGETWTEVVTDNAMANGFQGLAIDEDDNLFVLGESGVVGTGTLRKFDSDGDLVTAFGTDGVVNPTARLTGLSILSNGTLIATTFGGQLYTFDPMTGAEAAAANTGSGNFVRDIVVRPDEVGGEDIIFATRSGSLVQFTGGSAADPMGYTTTTVVSAQPDASFQVRPGVAYNASDDTVIFGNYGTQFTVVDAATGSVQQVLTERNDDGDPFDLTADAVTLNGNDGYEYLVLSHNNSEFTILRREVAPTAVDDWMLIRH